MAVREFTDTSGVEWRVWEVSADRMHPVTRIEDLLELATGWLAFESKDEKRRLPAPYPVEWDTLPLPELERLCRQAPPVTRRPSRTSGEHRAVTATTTIDEEIRTSGEVRFYSPRGREWTVRLHECLDRAGNHQVVLRLTAEDVVVDVDHWPAHWMDCTPEQFALMLLDAAPPRRVGNAGPQRRLSDRPRTAG